MLKIDYSNLPNDSGKLNFIIRYIFNLIRTWYLFHFKYPWVKYDGFIRIMRHTTFAKMKIHLGHNVQFGPYCNISTDVIFGNNILLAGRVCIIGKNDHTFNIPCQLIWNGARGKEHTTIIADDVWIGHNSTVLAGITIGKGSIVAAGSVVNKSIPPCEIWGGIPAKKIKDRFNSIEDKKAHLDFLNQTF
jgi:acetyltransferase-like isoleucine patch superfamily enzyme